MGPVRRNKNSSPGKNDSVLESSSEKLTTTNLPYYLKAGLLSNGWLLYQTFQLHPDVPSEILIPA